MKFKIRIMPTAEAVFEQLKRSDPIRYRKVGKCLFLLSQDPKYPGLKSKRYESLDGRHQEAIWQSYAENNVPAVFRVFWHYGPADGEITIAAITPHP
jgi:hypothetical protein